ncbi:cystatin-like [Scleropages formosus]|uniref:cystatin-like n=1 Tax=Scleropages formosus TaxID=113540 RepID=UPI0008790231|nr:cystatin-like [Scleropages formosus]XP_018584019.1 cystatin-like [Scleropages formosus]
MGSPRSADMSSTFRVLWALVSLAALSASAPLSPGAVEDANRDDPELEACAAFALRTFNHFNKDPHLYVITKITSARKANVGGGRYDMCVELRKTQCMKQDQVAKDSCQVLLPPDDEVFRCQFAVLSAPWRNERALIRNSCTPAAKSGRDSQ